MSNNSKWTQEQELELIKSMVGGSSLSEIAKKFGRSENSVEMRLKRIIYENIVDRDKSIEDIGSILSMNNDKVKQHYYSYKDYIEKKQKEHDKQMNNSKEHNMSGGSHKSDKMKKKFKRIEQENKIMKLILENKELTHKINKLIKEGKIDKSIKDYIKSLRH